MPEAERVARAGLGENGVEGCGGAGVEIVQRLAEAGCGVGEVGGAGPDGRVDSYYLQGTWTITGERRGYKPNAGIADTVKPSSTRGAIELVAKLDHIEFDVDGARTEAVDGFLLGVNWYVNRNVKLMLNIIHVEADNVGATGTKDSGDVISTRIQIAI